MKVQMLANIIPVINYANALLIIIIILALVQIIAPKMELILLFQANIEPVYLAIRDVCNAIIKEVVPVVFLDLLMIMLLKHVNAKIQPLCFKGNATFYVQLAHIKRGLIVWNVQMVVQNVMHKESAQIVFQNIIKTRMEFVCVYQMPITHPYIYSKLTENVITHVLMVQQLILLQIYVNLANSHVKTALLI